MLLSWACEDAIGLIILGSYYDIPALLLDIAVVYTLILDLFSVTLEFLLHPDMQYLEVEGEHNT